MRGEQFLRHPAPKAVILRHDIDKLPANALKMAHLEHDLGVAGSYYFRVKPGVWDPGVMETITALGHELGYHYEDPAIARGDFSTATAHLAELAGQGALPDQMMITVHPQRWHDRPLPWVKELVWQNVKNVVKRGVRLA